MAASMAADPLNFVRFHRGQRRFLELIRSPRTPGLTIVEFLKGNGVGGSFSLVGAWSAIMFGTQNPFFQGNPFGPAWPFLKSARLMSTKEGLKDLGPIQTALKALFPARRFRQGRGAGTAYYSEGSTDTGWTWDVLTYDQDVLQVAGANKGLVMFSEPPKADLFFEACTRLRGNGLILVEMTQMDMAQFNEEILDDCSWDKDGLVGHGHLRLDGKPVADVRVARADVEDACCEHSDGHRSHAAIEADIALWPMEEREARKTGKSLRMSGRIYPQWSEANELSALPDYHAKEWAAGNVRIASCIDPHDRKPWAMTWFACFKNEDVIAFAEWPSFDFASCKASPVSDIEVYRGIVLETEAAIKKPINMRFIDPLFSEAPGKGNARTIRQMLSGPCRRCLEEAGARLEDDERSETWRRAAEKCKHRLNYYGWLAYDGSIRDGHILVRTAIGDSSPTSGARPKLYAMKTAVPNFVRGMRRYAYHEEKNPLKALSERPQYVEKDFPDLVRGLYLMQGEKWPHFAPKPPFMHPPRGRGRGTTNPR